MGDSASNVTLSTSQGKENVPEVFIGAGGVVQVIPPMSDPTSNAMSRVVSGLPPPLYIDSSGVVGAVASSAYNQELFRIGVRLELPSRESVQEFAKFSMGEINCFAVSLKKSEDLLLLSDHHWSTGLNEAGSQSWCMKRVPWFQDPLKRITALSFDDEGTLYIGTLDGNVIELKALRLLSDQRDLDISVLYRLLHKIVQILVWNQDNSKVLLCVGSHGNLAIIGSSFTPVNVSFTTSIVRAELFQNKVGLTCALVCLETGHNVYTVLDDLDLPSQQSESQQKKSIFRKAKDNLMSRLSEDKLHFFSSKRSKPDLPSNTPSTGSVASSGTASSATTGSAPNVTITMSGGGGGAQTPSGAINAQQLNSSSDSKFTAPVTTSGSGSASIKFQSLEEFQCRGELRKVKGRSQFAKHAVNKLDIFDDDFRQVSSVFVASDISSVFVINRLYYCVDNLGKILRISLVHNGSLKDIAVIPFIPRILSVETMGESPDSSCSVFIIAEDGIYELTLRKDPVNTCVSLLLRETNTGMLDAICNAMNVSKSQVCSIAGDIKADEGKFSKSILYYKLAGLTYAQISAKFGSKGLMPAMLFFFELVDQEKTKLYGGFSDKQVMSDLAMLGRIEQYLRYGSTIRSKEMPRNPGILVQKMITNNIWFSSKRVAQWLSEPDLLWALKLLGETRLCYPDILYGLHLMDEEKLVECLKKNLIWKLMTKDWLALYSAPPLVFVWFREIVVRYANLVDVKVLNRLLLVLLPWRRELQRKIFTEISETADVINYASPMNVPRIMLDDYVELFVIVLLELIRRKKKLELLPSYVYKSDARQIQRMEIQNHKTNMVATLMLSFTFQKTLSASQSHVLSIRNGKVYAWGENKYGKLGVAGGLWQNSSEREKFQYHTPTPVSIAPVLKLHVESVCAGANHSVALTTVGTLLVWGQNNFGQLGLGPDKLWSARPVPLEMPDVIFTCVAAGSYHTVAVDHLNRAWSWGWGVHGQLGTGRVENAYFPQLVDIQEKIVAVAAGHSHTAFLTCFGRVLTTGCNHFGQLGLGIQGQKVKRPQMINALPHATLIRIVECGISSTVMVSTKNRLFYSGLNPASLKSLLNSNRRKEKKAGGGASDEDKVEEERDFQEPTMIDTSHMAGDIAKVNCSSTHFAVMSSLGYVYTWGVGKSGQLVRPDDDSKSLELIYSADDKMIIASDVCCAGDCTFVVEKESGSLFGCGFNSCGQLGKMESEEDQAVMMIRTKKRVVKVRQPSNIYFKLREIPGLPKQHSWETENSVMSTHKIAPPVRDVNQELLEWVIKAFRRNYDAPKMIQNCLKSENFKAASILETMAENHEQALQHNLAGAGAVKTGAREAIARYLGSIEHTKFPTIEQACRFLTIVIHHWSKFSLSGCDLEEILEEQRQMPSWGPCLCSAVKEVISLADESADWIAGNLTPVFILKCINESSKWSPGGDEAEEGGHPHNHSISTGSSSNKTPAATSSGDNAQFISSSNSTNHEAADGGATGASSSSAASSSASSTLNVLNGNVSFGSLCQSSASK